MKKVFVSVPMRGRDDEQIAASILKMRQLAEIIFGEELEAVSTFCTPQEREERTPDDVINQGIWEISLAAELMSKCDYYVGISDTWDNMGCGIENHISSVKNMQRVLFERMDVAPDSVPMGQPFPVEGY